MDNNKKIKSQIVEKIGIDEIINKQMAHKQSDAMNELDEKDKEKIKKKLKAQMEMELQEQLDKEIKDQIERKKKEKERKEKIVKTVKKVCAVIAAGIAGYCTILLVFGIIKTILFRKRR